MGLHIFTHLIWRELLYTSNFYPHNIVSVSLCNVVDLKVFTYLSCTYTCLKTLTKPHLDYAGYFILRIFRASPEGCGVNLGQLCSVFHVSFRAFVHVLVKALQQFQLLLVSRGDLRYGAEEARTEALLPRASWIHTENNSQVLTSYNITKQRCSIHKQ